MQKRALVARARNEVTVGVAVPAAAARRPAAAAGGVALAVGEAVGDAVGSGVGTVPVALTMDGAAHEAVDVAVVAVDAVRVVELARPAEVRARRRDRIDLARRSGRCA